MSPEADKMLSHIRTNPGRTAFEIAKDTGKPIDAVKTLLAAMRHLGVVYCVGNTKATKYYDNTPFSEEDAKEA